MTWIVSSVCDVATYASFKCPKLVYLDRRRSEKTEVRHLVFEINFDFKKIVRDAVGDGYVETNYFSPAFARYHGGFAGFSRVPTIVEVDNCLSGHGQVVVPVVKFDVGGLTGEQYLETMG